MDTTTIIMLVLVCLLAYFLKGLSGFGSALFFVPAVSVLFSPRTAIAASAFVDLWVGAAMLVTLKYERGDARIILSMAACLAVGAVVGGRLVGVIPQNTLLLLIGLVVLVLGGQILWRLRKARQHTTGGSNFWLWIACVGGGFAGGLVGISGPPIIAAMRPRMDKNQFRRRIAALFFFGALVRLIVYVTSGVWSSEALTVSLLAGPAIVVGLVLGYRWHGAVSERGFSAVAGGALVILAVRVLLQATGVL